VAGGIFAAYFVVALLVLIAQPFKPKKRDFSTLNARRRFACAGLRFCRSGKRSATRHNSAQ
jgi:hypothetical protein